jgi:predicted membrane protein
LRLNDDVPMALSVDLGVGNGNLDLGRLSLTSLDIQAGAGNITVDLTGIRSLTSLGLEMGAGNVTLDLTGDLEKDLNASIRGGVGTANVRLPSNVGVRVEARGALGTVNARGLTRDGNAYINDAYGQSDVTLRINIEGAVGTVNLELGD